MPINNQRGQGLIEYVMLVGLVGVASLLMVTKLQHAIKTNLYNVIYALQGKGAAAHAAHQSLRQGDLSRRDFSDFWKGSHSAGHGHDEGED